jgi:hypothetical protein
MPVSLCGCIYMYVCMYVFDMNICVCANERNMYMYICMYACINILGPLKMYTWLRSYCCTRMYACMHAYIHIYRYANAG